MKTRTVCTRQNGVFDTLRQIPRVFQQVRPDLGDLLHGHN